MQILILQYDPAQVKEGAASALMTQLVNAKHGAVILAPPNIKFEVITLDDTEHMGEVMFGVTKNGSQVKILYDPQEEALRIQKQKDAQDEYKKKH